MNDSRINKANQVTTYHEKKIGKTLYRVTSVFMGEFELSKAIEDLTIKKILHGNNISLLNKYK